MPRLLTNKSKFKSDNYINISMLTTINKEFQATTAKSVPSNNVVINALDNNKLFSPVTSTKHLCSCGSKRIDKDSEDSNSKSKRVTTPHSVFTKGLT